ncbi:hypothetical protein TNCV_5085631 [Trichonephila clavipes]|uniref:Uncharacterized protein n=1 Tax=Trichonephila clavipes TaxID=2585209 RepID=A0A8X6S9N2_TRICX|nr:hypothetical protein TNCV_5085631 [Trichonephila clavipes]
MARETKKSLGTSGVENSHLLAEACSEPLGMCLMECQGSMEHSLKTTGLDDVTRWLIAGRLETGQSLATICRNLGVTRNVVSTLWKQFTETEPWPTNLVKVAKEQ